MRVHHRLTMRTKFVNCHVHLNLAGNIPASLEFDSVPIHDDHVADAHHRFSDRSWRSENPAVIKTKRQIAVGGRYERLLMEQLAKIDQLLAALFLFRSQSFAQ